MPVLLSGISGSSSWYCCVWVSQGCLRSPQGLYALPELITKGAQCLSDLWTTRLMETPNIPAAGVHPELWYTLRNGQAHIGTECFSTTVLKYGNATLKMYLANANISLLRREETAWNDSLPIIKQMCVCVCVCVLSLRSRWARAIRLEVEYVVWPVALFYDTLQHAGVNTHVLHWPCEVEAIQRMI